MIKTAPARDMADAADLVPPSPPDLAVLDRAFVRILRGGRERMVRRRGRIEGAGYILLVSLESREPARLSDLAAILRLDASTVSRQVRGLEDQGLVRREPDPDDRRACRLAITNAGRDEVTLQRRERHAVLARAMSNWPDTDRAQLVTLLERLADDVEASLPHSDTILARAPREV